MRLIYIGVYFGTVLPGDDKYLKIKLRHLKFEFSPPLSGAFKICQYVTLIHINITCYKYNVILLYTIKLNKLILHWCRGKCNVYNYYNYLCILLLIKCVQALYIIFMCSLLYTPY